MMAETSLASNQLAFAHAEDQRRALPRGHDFPRAGRRTSPRCPLSALDVPQRFAHRLEKKAAALLVARASILVVVGDEVAKHLRVRLRLKV